jgi:hypothetical protein
MSIRHSEICVHFRYTLHTIFISKTMRVNCTHTTHISYFLDEFNVCTYKVEIKSRNQILLKSNRIHSSIKNGSIKVTQTIIT